MLSIKTRKTAIPWHHFCRSLSLSTMCLYFYHYGCISIPTMVDMFIPTILYLVPHIQNEHCGFPESYTYIWFAYLRTSYRFVTAMVEELCLWMPLNNKKCFSHGTRTANASNLQPPRHARVIILTKWKICLKIEWFSRIFV